MNEENRTTDRLERIEALLEKQVELGQKTLRSAKVRNIVLIICTIVFVIGIIAIGSSITQALEAIAQFSEFDVYSLNEAIAGIASIRYDALNDSIQSLADIIRPLANLIRAFS
jgi:uncharacterized membrane protein